MVNDARCQAVLFLVFHALRQLVQGEAGEIFIQRLERIVGQGSADCLPGQRVVAHNGVLGYVFHLTRLGVLDAELHRRFGIGENALRQRHRAGDCERHADTEDQDACKLHYLPPTCSSLPSTTPAATVMVALSDAGSSARAVPFLMRASTVLLPVLSFWMNVTMVPSGTGLPLQSRIGSVSTMVYCPV